jgi:lipopolysaccharide/colanic/teichoic acid biosynthesis glycosyltransferase
MSYGHSAVESSQASGVVALKNQRAVRGLDLAGSALGLILLCPLFAILALMIKLTSRGPVFFRWVRVGQDARPFTLLKFRSMVTGAPAIGPAITWANDPRVTGVGQMLRRLKLDELPQLLNVLRGEMSLVGPRPEDPAYVALYTPEQLAILKFRPGITSPASLRYRDESSLLSGDHWQDLYVHELMPAKLALDLEYFSRRTIWSDIRVIFGTLAGCRSIDERSRQPSPKGRL